MQDRNVHPEVHSDDAPFALGCERCGTESDLIPDRDLEGHFLCRACGEALARQQQFVDWGFGEAPDDLG